MHLLLISLSMIQSILTTMVGNASTSDFAENNEKLRILNKFKLSGNRSFILDSSFHPHRASFHLLTTPPTLIFHFLTPLSLQQLYLIQSSYAFHSHSPFHPSLVPENRNNQVIYFLCFYFFIPCAFSVFTLLSDDHILISRFFFFYYSKACYIIVFSVCILVVM